jgi:hypothetical protein
MFSTHHPQSRTTRAPRVHQSLSTTRPTNPPSTRKSSHQPAAPPMASLISMIDSMTVHQSPNIHDMLNDGRLPRFQQLMRASRLHKKRHDPVMYVWLGSL